MQIFSKNELKIKNVEKWYDNIVIKIYLLFECNYYLEIAKSMKI